MGGLRWWRGVGRGGGGGGRTSWWWEHKIWEEG